MTGTGPAAVPEADAVAGGVWGLLVGDALGVPFEFRSTKELPPLDQIDIPPPEGFRRAHVMAPPQAWSDDGAQALCLLESLLERGRLDLDDLGARLLRWATEGHMAVGRIVFDIGMQTSRSIGALERGVPAERAGGRSERENGNGSLMRVLPLALWHRGSDADLVRDAARQSLVTHAHPRSQVCCALYCLWVRAALQGSREPWRDATERLRMHSARDRVWTSELETHVRPDGDPDQRGTGYVVDCLLSARLAARELTFERVVRRAVSFGLDTDTTAAVAGGFAGVRHGLSGIPARWVEALPERPLVEGLVARLLSHRDGTRDGRSRLA